VTAEQVNINFSFSLVIIIYEWIEMGCVLKET